jgi:DNA-binding CsgD family transcriptional regulator
MLVGRDAELAQIGGLLEHARHGRSGTVVIRGEAGVGKSALLQYAVDNADGFTVLRGTGVEAESELAYAALHQILRPALDRIERLPLPQAAGLRAAFALSDETVDERFRVSVGVLGLLAEVAEEAPLLCIIDDAQWLDGASTDALLFAARRLEAERVALLIAARDDEEHSFVARGLPEMRLSALDAAQAHRLLTNRLGQEVSSTALEWLVRNANGNPLALMELPGTLTAPQLTGHAPLASTLPAPTSIEHVYMERVTTLPEETRRLLVLVATDDSGERATVEWAAGELGLTIEHLVPAERAGLLRVDADRIEFRHPLVRSAIYRSSPFVEREGAHRNLALASAAQGNPDRAAWHRAAATVGVDEDVARELESTAERARLRSGHAAAAAALERAADLTADSLAKARRLVAGAGAAWQAGQPERATALLDRVAPDVTEPRLRAEISNLRGVIGWRCGDVPHACTTLMTGAQQIASLDSTKALQMLCDAALACWDGGDFDKLAEVGRVAAALPPGSDPDHGLLADVLIGAVALSQGRVDTDLDRTVAAVNRAAGMDDSRMLIWAAIAAEMAGLPTLESQLLARVATLARASGAVDRLVVTLESMTVQGFLAGDFALATEATEGIRFARDAGLPNAASLFEAGLAWLAAVRGRAEECRRHAATATDLARTHRHGIANAIAEWALAMLDLGTGRPDAAMSRLIALSVAPVGISHPFYLVTSAPDLVEACVRNGNYEEARNAARRIETFASSDGPLWARAFAARCRALLAEGSAAEAHYKEALLLHADAGNDFERARSALLYGEFLRRERRRADAREHLQAALNLFESLHAEPWTARAQSELRATGATARKRDPSTFAELTPQELQIALLVAEGHANKAIAAQLFLSPRTVEYHLAKVFAKLSISSRAELMLHPVAAARHPAAAAS